MVVEFFGLPGSGKSTLRRELLEDELYYGDLFHEASYRKVSKKTSLSQLLPKKVQLRLFKEWWRGGGRELYFNKFLMEHPDIHSQLTHSVLESDENVRNLWFLFTKSISEYRLLLETRQCDEILCLNELFCQRAMSLAFRDDNYDIPCGTYFKTMIKPDVLIYVDVEPRICLNRQRERKDIVAKKDWLKDEEAVVMKKLKEVCEEIISVLEDYPIDIIRIDNNSDLNSSLLQIKSVLKKS